ncbi:MAG: hypothetical protein BGO59_20100 [Spirosoma sp. 48-14]|nr:MAG: hypothetical protein BGO59_20100 [Spirosoma sp. 48-14]
MQLSRLVLRKGVRVGYRLAGYQFLDKEQTEAFLRPYSLVTYPANALCMEEVVDLIDPSKVYYPQTQTETEPVSVWRYKTPAAGAELRPYGSVLTERNIPCTDINTDDFYQNVLHRQRRQSITVQTVIAPWSHYLDGIIWGGYYDFVFLVAAKLARIKGVLPEAVFRNATVAYPQFGTAYERDFMALLGVEAHQLIDTRKTSVQFRECIVANAGHWFYPNLADINALRTYILPQLPAPDTRRKRIYISRNCRRRITNEAALIQLLNQYEFQIIDDVPRSVTEQAAIYRDADFIVGPHGASFSNLIWCQPGTQLLELFAPTYYPDFFRYLANVLSMRYAAYFQGEAHPGNWTRGLEDDITVSIPEIEQCLKKMLGT